MSRKTMTKSIRMSKSRFTICMLMLLALFVPCEVFAIGQTTRVSISSTGVQGNGIYTYRPSISADGRYVAFASDANNLVDGDSNNSEDIFVHDRQTGQTTRVSVSWTGEQGNGGSLRPSISSDGRYVAFRSHADNLVDGDSNNDGDVFVHDEKGARH